METLDLYDDTNNQQQHQQHQQLNSSGDVESIASEQVYSYDYPNEDDQNNGGGGQFSELGSESGVEPDYTEWVFDEKAVVDDEFDITNEQALATLKYFCMSLIFFNFQPYNY